MTRKKGAGFERRAYNKRENNENEARKKRNIEIERGETGRWIEGEKYSKGGTR